MSDSVQQTDNSATKMKQPMTFFSIPLELRQDVYEHLFHTTDDGVPVLGGDSEEVREGLFIRQNVMKADPRLRQELQDWTGIRHKLSKKTRFCINPHFEETSCFEEELLELKASLQCNTLKTVEIYINHWTASEVFDCCGHDDFEDFSACDGYDYDRQLDGFHSNMKKVVEVLNHCCSSIQLLQVRYDPRWWDERWYKHMWDVGVDLVELDSLFGRNRSVLEYILEPLEDLTGCVCVNMEPSGRWIAPGNAVEIEQTRCFEACRKKMTELPSRSRHERSADKGRTSKSGLSRKGLATALSMLC